MGRAALVASVFAVTIVGALAWFSVGPGARAPTGGCTTAPTSPIGSPSAPVDPPQIGWTSSELPGGLDDGNEQAMLDVVAFNGGFVAVGRHSDGGHVRAFTLHSTDGFAWESGQGDDVRFAGTEIGSLVVAGDRLFAVGSAMIDDRGGVRAAVWASDDGRTWRPAAGAFDEAHPASLADGETSGAIGGQVDAMGVTDDGRVIAVGTAYDRDSDAGPWISVGGASHRRRVSQAVSRRRHRPDVAGRRGRAVDSPSHRSQVRG